MHGALCDVHCLRLCAQLASIMLPAFHNNTKTSSDSLDLKVKLAAGIILASDVWHKHGRPQLRQMASFAGSTMQQDAHVPTRNSSIAQSEIDAVDDEDAFTLNQSGSVASLVAPLQQGNGNGGTASPSSPVAFSS